MRYKLLMSLKPSIVWIVFVFQLVSLSAFAERVSTASPVASPEFVLLRGAIALEGTKLTQDEQRSRLNATLSRYLATALPDGQVERMSQALIDLNITTSDEATAVVADARNMSAGLTADISLQQQQEILTDGIVQLVAHHPLMGAQFSACDVGGAIGISGLGLIGFVEIASKAGMNFGTGSFTALSYIGIGVVITVAGGIVMASSCFSG